MLFLGLPFATTGAQLLQDPEAEGKTPLMSAARQADAAAVARLTSGQGHALTARLSLAGQRLPWPP
jgi:hypothetical protein